MQRKACLILILCFCILSTAPAYSQKTAQEIAAELITEKNGNIGIGFANPIHKLVVAAGFGGGLALNFTNLLNQDLQVAVSAVDAVDKFALFGPSTPTNLALGVGGQEKMRITNAGNVGIGVKNPLQPLVIGGAGGKMLNVSNLINQDLQVTLSTTAATDKFALIAPSTPTNLALGVGGQEKMRITNTGNVGIGTSTPTAKLDVAGTVNATAFVGDGSALTGIASGTGGVENTGSTTIGATALILGSPLSLFLKASTGKENVPGTIVVLHH